MNISSVIIRIKNDEKLKSTLQILNDFKGVEIVTHEKSKIIATIQIIILIAAQTRLSLYL